MDYAPPDGIAKMDIDSIPTQSDQEIWLFKIPNEVNLEELDQLEIPKSKSKSTTLKVLKSNKYKKQKELKFTVEPLADQGEVKNFTVVAPVKGTLKTGMKIKRIYSVIPELDVTTAEDLEKAGEKALKTPYVPRKQIDDMQLKSLPIGFHTSGEALEKCLERYNLRPKSVASSGTSPKAKKHKKSKK